MRSLHIAAFSSMAKKKKQKPKKQPVALDHGLSCIVREVQAVSGMARALQRDTPAIAIHQTAGQHHDLPNNLFAQVQSTVLLTNQQQCKTCFCFHSVLLFSALTIICSGYLHFLLPVLCSLGEKRPMFHIH